MDNAIISKNTYLKCWEMSLVTPRHTVAESACYDTLRLAVAAAVKAGAEKTFVRHAWEKRGPSWANGWHQVR